MIFPRVRRATRGEILKKLVIAVPALALPFVIRAAVVEGIATATEVSTIGIAYAVLAGLLIYRRFEWLRLKPMLVDTAALSGAILLIIGAATGMAWALTQSGFSGQLARTMGALPGGAAMFMAASIAAFIVLGSVLEGIPAIVLFGPLMFPIARADGHPRCALFDGRDPLDGRWPVRAAVRGWLLLRLRGEPHQSGRGHEADRRLYRGADRRADRGRGGAVDLDGLPALIHPCPSLPGARGALLPTILPSKALDAARIRAAQERCVMSIHKARPLADAIRFLAIDAIVRAGEGHQGVPLGMAEIATALFTRHLKFNPADPQWPDRDRFVLSNGHGSMLLYALLHLTGYPHFGLDALKSFREMGSHCAGHPEFDPALGIEVTTGPLGQGIANAFGMAVAEAYQNARFGDGIVDHYTYAFVGDGCLQEGIGQEMISLAGHLQLGKLILCWDDNQITDDGSTSLSISEDVSARFRVAGWHVIEVDGHDLEAVSAALVIARRDPRPSMIACRTVIARGIARLQGQRGGHSGKLFDADADAARTRTRLAARAVRSARRRARCMARRGTAQRRRVSRVAGTRGRAAGRGARRIRAHSGGPSARRLA